MPHTTNIKHCDMEKHNESLTSNSHTSPTKTDRLHKPSILNCFLYNRTAVKKQRKFSKPQKNIPNIWHALKSDACRANKRVVIFLCVRDKWRARRCQSGRVGPYNNRCHNARCNLLSACSLGYI